jgi:hypothetical protein
MWSAVLPVLAITEAFWRGALPLGHTGWNFGKHVDLIAKDPGPVIYLPFGSTEDAMVYQTRHGQPMFGGMGEREPDLRPPGYEKRLQNTFVMMLGATLNDKDPAIGYTKEDREAITSVYRWVVLDIRSHPSQWNKLDYDLGGRIRRFDQELGQPVSMEDTIVVWDLHAVVADPPGLRPDAKLATEEELRPVLDHRTTNDEIAKTLRTGMTSAGTPAPQPPPPVPTAPTQPVGAPTPATP